MIARLLVSSRSSKRVGQLTNQPSTRSRGIEQRILRPKDDFDSDTSNSTSCKLVIGQGRRSLRSDDLKLGHQPCTE
jgi:hypothetical protein